MRALWLKDRELSVREVPVPERPDEALIRVRLSGICGTDLELEKGYYPYDGVLGHEFVGEVVFAPEPSLIGRRVVGEINVACGECEPCVRGHRTHCERRSVLGIVSRDGVHAEYTTLPVENLHVIPDGVPDEAAVFTEPLAAALEILEQVPVSADDRVLLVGAGRLGQLVARVLQMTHARLHVVARYDRQIALLHGVGIPTLEPEEVEPRRFDVVVEATGSPSGFELARTAVRPRGTLVLKSTYHGDLTLDVAPFVVDEITIVGSRCGPFPPALALLESRRIDPTPLIAARFPLEQGIEAMASAGLSSMLKVLLEP